VAVRLKQVLRPLLQLPHLSVVVVQRKLNQPLPALQLRLKSVAAQLKPALRPLRQLLHLSVVAVRLRPNQQPLLPVLRLSVAVVRQKQQADCCFKNPALPHCCPIVWGSK
jgi:hypothetical protein